jgi:hypothetical protein
MNHQKTAAVVLVSLFILGGGFKIAKADPQLLTNGNFETGDFTGWGTASETGSTGAFLISSPESSSPISGSPTPSNPSGGSFYAVSDEGDVSSSVLYQSFVVPANTPKLTLTFQMFIDNYNVATEAAPDLDYNDNPNQQVRVDILNSTFDPSTDAFSVDPSEVVQDLFTSGTDAEGNPNPYETYTFDLSNLTSSPGTYYVRFAQVDDLNYLVAGVDNVSILATPEPSTYALMLGALALLGFAVKRKRAAAVVRA